jgi:hypothetical protein
MQTTLACNGSYSPIVGQHFIQAVEFVEFGGGQFLAYGNYSGLVGKFMM